MFQDLITAVRRVRHSEPVPRDSRFAPANIEPEAVDGARTTEHARDERRREQIDVDRELALRRREMQQRSAFPPEAPTADPITIAPQGPDTVMPPSRHAATAKTRVQEHPQSLVALHARLRPASALRLLQ